MKKLYTFILEFGKGTYVSQVSEENFNAALVKWMKADGIRSEGAHVIHENNPKVMALLEKQFNYPWVEPTKLSGCENVWYHSFTVNKKWGYVHIIQTKLTKQNTTYVTEEIE